MILLYFIFLYFAVAQKCYIHHFAEPLAMHLAGCEYCGWRQKPWSSMDLSMSPVADDHGTPRMKTALSTVENLGDDQNRLVWLVLGETHHELNTVLEMLLPTTVILAS